MQQNDIHLERITFDNVGKIVDLKLTREQKDFVGNNAQSLALAYVTLSEGDPVFPFAICHGKTPVGFIMIDYNDDWTGYGRDAWIHSADYKFYQGKPFYYIWRFMIDKRYQHRGYGRAALEKAMDFIKTFPCGKADYCVLSYFLKNQAAREFYRAFGFRELNEPGYYEEGDEVSAVLKL